MFEKTPVQEKSFKGFLKRLALRLKEHPRIFAFVRFFVVFIISFNAFFFVTTDSPKLFSISSLATFAACPPILATFLFSSNP